LVTSASVDASAVAVIAKAVLGNVAELRTLHPALARLRAREMIIRGLTAPLHPAASQVYKEFGLLEAKSAPGEAHLPGIDPLPWGLFYGRDRWSIPSAIGS
jgi:hypothetical protein